MKKWKSTILPAILTVLILITGFSATFIARKIIPDGMDTVKGYDKTAVKNKIITFDEPENLTLFPWNLYSKEKAIPISQFDDIAACDAEADLEAFLMNFDQNLIIAEDDIISKFEIMDTDRYLYIKDVAVIKKSDNKKYLLNMVIDMYENMLIYYDLKPQNTSEITPQLKNEANDVISEIISGDLNYDNKLRKFTEKFNGFGLGYNLSYITERFPDISYFFYQDEILLCFSGTEQKTDYEERMEYENEMEPDYFETVVKHTKTVIVFYNIFEKEFTGFTFQY